MQKAQKTGLAQSLQATNKMNQEMRSRYGLGFPYTV
jgi:hypothetical protein